MRRSLSSRLPLAIYALAAAAVGLAVTLGALAFARGSCPSPPDDPVALVSSCRGLIASLAVRVGITVGLVVFLIQLVVAGLDRTLEQMEQNRRSLVDEVGGR